MSFLSQLLGRDLKDPLGLYKDQQNVTQPRAAGITPPKQAEQPQQRATPPVERSTPQFDDRDWNDIVDTVIAEAGGEGPEGMAAVSAVIKNRSERRGKSPADVVREPDQFDGYSAPGSGSQRAQRDPSLRAKAEQIVRGIFDGELADPTGGADHFHADSVSPGWARRLQPTTKIGRHSFYSSDQQAVTAAKPEEKPATVPGNPAGKGMARLAPPETVTSATDFLTSRLVGKNAEHVTGMQPELQDRLAALLQAAPPEIADQLGIYSGARSVTRQRQLWSQALKKYGSAEEARKWVAPPGSSKHNHGQAADLSFGGESLSKAPKEVVDWVHANAGQYGLSFPLAHEPWHIEVAEARGGKAPDDLADRLTPAKAKASKTPISLDDAFQARDPMGLYRDRPNPFAVSAPAAAPAAPAEQPADTSQTDRSLEMLEAAEPGRYQAIDESQFGEWQAKWEAENRSTGLVGDTSRLLAAGWAGLGQTVREGVRELANGTLLPGTQIGAEAFRQATGKNPGDVVVDTLDAIDEWWRGDGVSAEQNLQRNVDQNIASLSPETGAAREKAWWDSDRMRPGPAWQDPRSYFAGITESLPGTVATMAPSMWLARGTYVAALAKGVEQKAAAAAAARTATIAGAMSEGLMGGGQTALEVRKQIAALPPETLQRSETFQTLLQSGLNEREAVEALANDAATQGFVLGGVATGAFGGMGDRALAKILAEGVGGSVVKRIIGGALKGTVGEGVLEEAPQSAAQQLAQNQAMQAANPDQSLMEGVPEAAAGGLAVGGAMGAGMGAAGGAASPRLPAEAAGAEEAVAPPKAGPLARAVEYGSGKAAPNRTFVVSDPAFEDYPKGELDGQTVTLAPDQTGVKPNMHRVITADGATRVIGKRLLVERSTAPEQAAAPATVPETPPSGTGAGSAQVPEGAPAVGSTVRVEAEGVEPFMARVDGYEGDEAIVFDSSSGEVYQIPAGNLSPMAPQGPAEPPVTAPEEPASTEELPPTMPTAGVTTTEMPARSEQKAASAAFPPIQQGTRVIVDDPAGGRFAARVESFEEDGSEALVIKDDGTPQQVPFTALHVSKLTTKEVEAEELRRNPPVEREKPALEGTSRQVGKAVVTMPDDTHARLYDLGKERQTSRKLLGAGQADIDRVMPVAQRELADELGISSEAAGQMADDYRYRVERAAKGARSELPLKMHTINDRRLKQWQAERQKAEAEAPANSALEVWWDGELSPAQRREKLDATNIRRSERTMWGSFPKALQERLAATRETPAPVDETGGTAVAETPAVVVPAETVDAGAHVAATSPTNDLPEPTQAQKEAGNYKVGRVKFAGLDISIENPAGSTRSGTSRSGKPWSVEMKSHYGYILGTVGRDKDHIDVFVNPGRVTAPTDADPVYVVDQVAKGKFDEHKVMMGYGSADEARTAYLENYSKGWKGLGSLTPTTVGEFKRWLDEGDTKRPFADSGGGVSDAPPQSIDSGSDVGRLEKARAAQRAGEDKGKTSPKARIIRNVLGAAPGQTVAASAGIDMSDGGHPYRLRSVDQNGDVHVEDPATGASVTWKFADILKARNDGVTFEVSGAPMKASVGRSEPPRTDGHRQFGIPSKAVTISGFRDIEPLKDHPDYKAAKGGDAAAAARLVEALVKPEWIDQAARSFGGNSIYVPVAAVEASGVNKIPAMLATFYATTTDARVSGDILQVNRAFHTGAKAAERLTSRVRFDGPVERGARYVLVDDVTVMGSTLADMADHIRRGGGEVAGVITLVNTSRVEHMSATKQQVRWIEERFGDALRQDVGLDPGSLTGAEAIYILGFRNVDGLRDRLAKARDERSDRLRAKGVRPPSEDPEGGLKPSKVPAVADIRGDELGVAFGGAEDMPALRKAAIRWYNEHLHGTTATMADGTEVRFTRRGRGKSTYGGKGDRLLRSVPAIRAIIEKGTVVAREPGDHGRIRERLVVAAPVSFQGDTISLAVSVHRTPEGHYQYDLTFDRSGPPGRAGIASVASGGPRVARGGRAPSERPLTGFDLPPASDGLNLVEWTPESNEAGKSALREELAAGRFGATVSSLLDAGKVRIVPPSAAPQPDWQAWTDTDDTIFLVEGRIPAGEASAVLLHEAFHAGARPLLGDTAWGDLMKRLGGIHRQFERSSGGARRFFDAARDRLSRAGEMAADLTVEEFGAYAIEEYAAAPRTLRSWADDAVGAVKAWLLRRFGRQVGAVTPAQLRAIAAAALRDTAQNGYDTRSSAASRKASVVPPSREKVASQIAGRLTDLQPTALALVPLNYFTDLARPSMTAVAEYLRVKRKLDAYRGKKHAAADTTAQAWLKFSRLGQAKAQALAGLMHDATLAGVDPSKTDAETSGKSGYADLRKRFLDLPPAGRELFQQVRDGYRQQADELDRILLDNVRKAQEIAQRKAEAEYRETVESIGKARMRPDARKEALEEAEKDYKAKTTRAQWSMKARLTKLRIAFESSRVPEPYFPLARFGRYFVTVKDVDGTVLSFSRRERKADVDRLAADMRKAYPTAAVEVGVTEDRTAVKDAMDPRIIAEIETLVGNLGVGGDMSSALMDGIWQRYLQSMPDLSTRKRFIHRKGTAGFDADALRAYSSHMFHAAHQMGRLKYGLELQELVSETVDQARKSDDTVRGMTLANELKKRHDWVMNPTGSKAAQFVTSAMFVWYLGLTPAAAIVNLSQTPMLGIPILGGRFGMGKASAALLKASADLVRGRGSIAKAGLPADERHAIEEFYESGLIDRSQAHDLAGVGETGIEYSPLRAKVMGVISWAFHSIEVLNREATALAAYRLARGAGQDQSQAIDTAHDLTWKTHFDYSNSSRARFLQNDFAKVALVFQSYQLNMWYRLFRDIRQSFKGESAQVRKEARYQLAGVMGMMSLMGGLTGLFGYNVLMALADQLFGDDDDPFAFRDGAEKAIMDMFGTDIGRMILKGVPGPLLGIDLTSRLGMPDFFIRAPDTGAEGRDWWMQMLIGMLGVSAQTVLNVGDGLDMVTSGNVFRGVEVAAPKAVKDVMKSYRYASEGVLNRRGDPTMERSELDAWDIIATVIGFTPAKVSERYDRIDQLKDAEREVLDRRRELVNRFALATMMDDDESRAEAREAIKRFNQGRFGRVMPITPDTLRQSLRTRARNADKREDGILFQNERLGRALTAEMAESD